jgi:outer membrane receptor protein involved in Fe transport
VRLGHGDWGAFTATMNGTYLSEVKIQPVPGAPFQNVVGKFGAGFQGGGNYSHNRWYVSLFYDGPSETWMHGIDLGLTAHYVGQYWDSYFFTDFSTQPRPGAPSGVVGLHDRKVREWTTLDLIANYSFNLPLPKPQTEVAGYAKNGETAKKALPVSTAEYNLCGWRAWLNNATLTLGINNVLDEQPPFVAGAIGSNYDTSSANPKGRFWFVGVKKRF